MRRGEYMRRDGYGILGAGPNRPSHASWRRDA
jgi:hypothetical protein